MTPARKFFGGLGAALLLAGSAAVWAGTVETINSIARQTADR